MTAHNHKTRTINYTPRLDQWQALELMPHTLRQRVNNGAFSWDPYSILRQYRRWVEQWGTSRALAATIAWLDRADEKEAAKPWTDIHGNRILPPTVALRVASITLKDLL